MKASDEYEKLKQLVQKVVPQSKLIRKWTLEGGVSAQVTVLEIERPCGQKEKMVVRRHGEVDRKQNPDVAADEFRLLQITQASGLATPKPYYLDQSCDIFPTPYIVIEYIEGETEFAPDDLADCVLQLATHLSRIHSIDLSGLDLSFLPEQAEIYAREFGERPAKVDKSIGEGRIRDILEAIWPLPQRNESVLLHGDFWPGNVLWRDGQLVAVIDWEDAQYGDPLADVANGRLEILWAFGVDAMNDFTHHYQSMTSIDFTNLPYWDLCAALRPAFKISGFADDDVAERKMRREHRWFVNQAYEAICLPKAEAPTSSFNLPR